LNGGCSIFVCLRLSFHGKSTKPPDLYRTTDRPRSFEAEALFALLTFYNVFVGLVLMLVFAHEGKNCKQDIKKLFENRAKFKE